MRRLIRIVGMIVSFIALLPLSWRLVDPLFSHPFAASSFDPLLLVCRDHLEVLHWHDISGRSEQLAEPGCTFQISPTRQAWVEAAVKKLSAPVPSKAAWIVRIKQLGGDDQRIEFELLGDGFSGMSTRCGAAGSVRFAHAGSGLRVPFRRSL